MEPDLTRDAAALFEHLRKLGEDGDELKRWCFMFESEDIEQLEELAVFLDSRLREFFHVLIQDETEVLDDDGQISAGPPLLRLEFVGVVDQPLLTGMHRRLEELATDYGVAYQGCASHTEFPFDLDLFEAALTNEQPREFMSDEEEE